ncbi:hypothetical protein [Nocardia africana]
MDDTEFEQNANEYVRSAIAILTAAHHDDEDGIRAVLSGGNTFETVWSLAVLALTFADLAGIDVDTYSATAFADLNAEDGAA